MDVYRLLGFDRHPPPPRPARHYAQQPRAPEPANTAEPVTRIARPRGLAVKPAAPTDDAKPNDVHEQHQHERQNNNADAR